MVNENDVAVILEREAIKELKARYFLCIDSRAWEEWRTLFTPDARIGGNGMNHGMPTQTFEEFFESAKQVHHLPGSTHQGHTPIIEVTGSDSARGLWSMDAARPTGYHGSLRGFYEEVYRKVAGAWKIAEMSIFLIPGSPGTANRADEANYAALQQLVTRWMKSVGGA